MSFCRIRNAINIQKLVLAFNNLTLRKKFELSVIVLGYATILSFVYFYINKRKNHRKISKQAIEYNDKYLLDDPIITMFPHKETIWDSEWDTNCNETFDY